jgi:hypothetical protein
VRYQETQADPYNTIQFLFTKRGHFDREKELPFPDPPSSMDLRMGAARVASPLDERMHGSTDPIGPLATGQVTSSAPTEVTFTGIPIDAPGSGANRTLTISNLRVNANALGVGTSENFQVRRPGIEDNSAQTIGRSGRARSADDFLSVRHNGDGLYRTALRIGLNAHLMRARDLHKGFHSLTSMSIHNL